MSQRQPDPDENENTADATVKPSFECGARRERTAEASRRPMRAELIRGVHACLAHLARKRAVTSISICMRESSKPAQIIVIAGRTAPKYLRNTGQHSEKRSPLGTM
jgi:hypothetical protein